MLGVLAAVAMAGFVAYVVVSAREAAVPVGASGSMPGMSMPMGGGGGVRFTTRDVNGDELRLPGGRPGAMVFVAARYCESCVAVTRAAAAAVRRVNGRAALIVVVMDAATSRDDIAEFARSARRPDARYVVDDRNGSVQSMLDAPALASAVIYNARGRIVARADADSRDWAKLLRRAGV